MVLIFGPGFFALDTDGRIFHGVQQTSKSMSTQARAQLEAMEPLRKQARRDGLPYELNSVVFDMTEPFAHAEKPVLLQIHPSDAN
ncbi:MAG: hypothetical protein RB191_05280 [Terriglobia bacterium]|nr:hypothetical protein [Terriglobia bacterium]